MAAGTVHIPWYATVFRGDKFGAALERIAPVALRYGATEQTVYRSRDDMYKFLQVAVFDEKVDFERYWYGEEFIAFRSEYAGWYQVPVTYAWHDVLSAGAVERQPLEPAGGNGAPA